MEVTVARDLLPEEERERSGFLKKYFCELAVSARETPEGWSLNLGRPDRDDFYIDPDLLQGLEWWSEKYGRVDVSGIPFAVHRRPGMHMSLNDSWTIYSWSRWLKESLAPREKPASVTLLHLDDHDDLMPPRVLIEGEAWLDPISGLALDLWKPETVESAVRSGAIGIGSFMAPLLHLFPNVHVRHLCSTEYAKERQGPHIVRPVQVIDDLLAPGSVRPALELLPVGDSPGAAARGDGHPYDVTDDLASWLRNLPGGPVLIHVDMDYFNNRFNGDSDWVDYGPKYDPPLSDVLLRIDQVFDALAGEGVAERVADFAVALSPGFFPADLWAPAVGRIEERVDELIGAGRWPTRE
jgi:hypothetical protein